VLRSSFPHIDNILTSRILLGYKLAIVFVVLEENARRYSTVRIKFHATSTIIIDRALLFSSNDSRDRSGLAMKEQISLPIFTKCKPETTHKQHQSKKTILKVFITKQFIKTCLNN
jgi:hypothetical protein